MELKTYGGLPLGAPIAMKMTQNGQKTRKTWGLEVLVFLCTFKFALHLFVLLYNYKTIVNFFPLLFFPSFFLVCDTLNAIIILNPMIDKSNVVGLLLPCTCYEYYVKWLTRLFPLYNPIHILMASSFGPLTFVWQWFGQC